MGLIPFLIRDEYVNPGPLTTGLTCARWNIETIPDGYNWFLNRRVYLKSVDDLDYVMGLIEQSYKDVL